MKNTQLTLDSISARVKLSLLFIVHEDFSSTGLRPPAAAVASTDRSATVWVILLNNCLSVMI